VPLNYSYVLNAVGGKDTLSPAYGEGIRMALGTLADCGDVDWLADARALDIPFNGPPDAVAAAFKEMATRWKLDINVVPAEGRKKELLIADMDSTIIGCECIDELADMAGIKPKVAEITERAMRGELDFESALRERVALLKGLPLESVARVYAERVRLNPGAKVLLRTMRANGAYCLLISGGFTYFTSRVAADAGFDGQQGNTLVDDGHALTGKVGEPILGRAAKLEALERAASERELDLFETMAIGDGANDLGMIQRAGLGVAYHAKPVVAEAAAAAITYGDLTGMLFLQGYREAEFVKG
jgi:phosphoserine phosphatase